MPTTDTSEKGLESLIAAALTGTRSDAVPTGDAVREPSVPYRGAGTPVKVAFYDLMARILAVET